GAAVATVAAAALAKAPDAPRPLPMITNADSSTRPRPTPARYGFEYGFALIALPVSFQPGNSCAQTNPRTIRRTEALCARAIAQRTASPLPAGLCGSIRQRCHPASHLLSRRSPRALREISVEAAHP